MTLAEIARNRHEMARPWKKAITPADLAGSCFFNTYFTSACLFDYSVQLWATDPAQAATVRDARLSFLHAFYEWKEAQPVVMYFMLLMLLLLPFALVSMTWEATCSALRWRRAHPIRHAADIISGLTLMCAILPSVFLAVAPAQSDLLRACAPAQRARTGEQCAAAAAALTPLHLRMLLLNLVMFACDVAKYARGGPPEDAKSKAE